MLLVPPDLVRLFGSTTLIELGDSSVGVLCRQLKRWEMIVSHLFQSGAIKHNAVALHRDDPRSMHAREPAWMIPCMNESVGPLWWRGLTQLKWHTIQSATLCSVIAWRADLVGDDPQKKNRLELIVSEFC